MSKKDKIIHVLEIIVEVCGTLLLLLPLLRQQWRGKRQRKRRR